MAKQTIDYEKAFESLKLDQHEVEQPLKDAYLAKLEVVGASEKILEMMGWAAIRALEDLADLIRANPEATEQETVTALTKVFVHILVVGMMTEERASSAEKKWSGVLQ